MIPTKLYRPSVDNDLVIREHLIKQLDKNIHKPLSLISAPSGYGKSLLVSQWIETCQVNAAWLSLDDEHQEFKSFLEYFVAALQKVVENDFERVTGIIKGQQEAPVRTVYQDLVKSLSKVEQNFVLVLDDYQVIKNKEIHEFINLFVHYPVKNFHLIITCRNDCPLDINQLRLYNRINEIRMEDLAFTLLETKSLVLKTLDLELSIEDIKHLNQRTEGWVLGLQILLRTNEIHKINKGIETTSHTALSKYADLIVEHILKDLSEEFQKLLFMSGIVGRFNAALIDRLIGFSDKMSLISGQSFVKELKKRNLFVYSLDNVGEWYRYHHFFNEMLQIHLEKYFTKAEISSLHLEISQWFEKKEYWEEAYDHALKAGEIDQAINIFNKNRIHFFNTDQIPRIGAWLKKLPARAIEKDLGLLVSKAILDEAVRDHRAMTYHMDIAKKLAEKNTDKSAVDKQLLGEFHAVYANLHFSFERNYNEALSHTSKALGLLKDSSQYIYGYALVVHLMTLNALGRFEEAQSILAGIEKSLKPGASIPMLYMSIVKCYLLAFRGELNEIGLAANKCLPVINEEGLGVLLSNVSYYLASSDYQHNKLLRAIESADLNRDHLYAGRAFWEIQTIYIKAFAQQALGEADKLSETLALINEMTQNNEAQRFHELTKAFMVELALRQGEVARALELAEATDFDSVYLDYSFYFQQLTYIRLLIITDYQGKSDEIEKLLKKYLEIGRVGHKYNLLMQVLLLQSVFSFKMGEKDAAMSALTEAIDLSRPGGFIRIYLDMGRPVMPLLKEISQNKTNQKYVKNILDAFEKEKAAKSNTKSNRQKVHLRHGIDLGNSTPTVTNQPKAPYALTLREQEVIILVGQGLRNKEIAERLNISEVTVKSHLTNIYGKLGVKNRSRMLYVLKSSSTNE